MSVELISSPEKPRHVYMLQQKYVIYISISLCIQKSNKENMFYFLFLLVIGNIWKLPFKHMMSPFLFSILFIVDSVCI